MLRRGQKLYIFGSRCQKYTQNTPKWHYRVCAFFHETRNALHRKIDIAPPELRDKRYRYLRRWRPSPKLRAPLTPHCNRKQHGFKSSRFQHWCRSAATGCACLIKNYAIMRRSSHYGGCARTNSTFVRSAHCERRSRRPRACALRRIRRSRVRSLSWKASLKKSRSSCFFSCAACVLSATAAFLLSAFLAKSCKKIPTSLGLYKQNLHFEM